MKEVVSNPNDKPTSFSFLFLSSSRFKIKKETVFLVDIVESKFIPIISVTFVTFYLYSG